MKQTTRFNIWSRAVRARDGNKCRLCGSRDKLDAHHIIHRRKSAILKFDLDNGITLCRDRCHAKAETIEGRERIKNEIGLDIWNKLSYFENQNIKDYLIKDGRGLEEFYDEKTNEAKEVLKNDGL